MIFKRMGERKISLKMQKCLFSLTDNCCLKYNDFHLIVEVVGDHIVNFIGVSVMAFVLWRRISMERIGAEARHRVPRHDMMGISINSSSALSSHTLSMNESLISKCKNSCTLWI